MASNFSTSLSPGSSIIMKAHVALLNHTVIHRLPSQKGRYNGSLIRAPELRRRTFTPRPCSCSALFGRGRLLQVNHKNKKAGSLIPSSRCTDKEEDSSLVLAPTSLLDDEEGSVAGLSAASNAPIYTTATFLTHGGSPIFSSAVSQTSNSENTSRIEHGHAVSTSSEMDMEAQTKQRILKKKAQQRLTYLFAAVASSMGITSLAGASVCCHFAWQMQGGEVPWIEMCGTFSLVLGATVGMEYWARWAHRALWHASLWSMHESHHRPRDGPFELNDVIAIINAVPAIALMAFGFSNKGLVPGLCLGAGLGITTFGIAYMFVHDGLVHKRFPVGSIADVPYFQKVAAAHQLHHADKYNGVPYGLFLGPMELAEVGGQKELEKLVQRRKRESKNPINS